MGMNCMNQKLGTNGPAEIRPHRFGGEGVLIGAQTATLNTQ